METQHTFIFLATFADGSTRFIEINLESNQPVYRMDVTGIARQTAASKAVKMGAYRLTMLDVAGEKTAELQALVREEMN